MRTRSRTSGWSITNEGQRRGRWLRSCCGNEPRWLDRVSRGCFVALEGVEGVGKSTQAALLSGWLTNQGVSHVRVREPGGTPLGEAVRAVLLESPDDGVPPESELMLILAARASLVQCVVRPALEKGHVVVSDRFDLSTLAYQGWGRGLNMEWVRRLNDFATGGLRPDLYLLFDLPTEEGLARQEASGKVHDRIEREGSAFLERVRQGFATLAGADERVRVVRASGSAEQVMKRVLDLLEAHDPETFRSSWD